LDSPLQTKKNKLKLTRTLIHESGACGELETDSGFLCYTLEHTYSRGAGLYTKLPDGEFTCRRGQHQLHSGPIETFEITGVPGHTGILFHPGNTQADSEGCVLLGMYRRSDMTLRSSRVAFERFMAYLEGVDEFTLVVE
jgi:hypothetical protein